MAQVSDEAPKRLSRAEKQAQTRRRLLEAAEDVFRHHGFHRATVEEITSQAGFSRGAFYSNFSSREELFVALLQERVYEDYRRMLDRVPPELSGPERIRWGARALAEYHRQPDQRWSFELWLELLAYAARHPEFAELAATFWRDNRAALAATIAEEGPSIEPTVAASIVLALDIGLKLQNLVDPEAVGLDLYEPVFETLFASLLPEGRGAE